MGSYEKAEAETFSAQLNWSVEKFESYTYSAQTNHCLLSEPFSCSKCSFIKWQLLIYPHASDTLRPLESDVEFVVRTDGFYCGEGPAITGVLLTVCDMCNRLFTVKRSDGELAKQFKFTVPREDLCSKMRDRGGLQLFLTVDFILPGLDLNAVSSKQFAAENVGSALLAQLSFQEMWKAERFTDCVIKVGNKQLKAHRCVLAQNSDVFRVMFEREEMLEAQTGVIKIVDSTPVCVRAMLQFFYTCSVDKEVLEKNAESIYAIADKYAVTLLQEHCERYLVSTLDVNNFVKRCLIANTYCAPLLKKACLKYISNNRTFLHGPEWGKLKVARTALAFEMIEAAFELTAKNAEEREQNELGGGGISTLVLTNPLRDNRVAYRGRGGFYVTPILREWSAADEW